MNQSGKIYKFGPFQLDTSECLLLCGGDRVGLEPQVYRTLLSTNGRLMLTYPAKVGRFPQKHALEFWEKRLGEPPRYPREVLQAIELCGFEPEAVETLDDGALAELYRGLEQKIDGNASAASLREEVDLFRGASNKASVSYAFAVARRKEPGEKPPASRDRG